MRSYRILLVLTLLAGTQARADLVISNRPTQGMSCSGGVCEQVSKRAVLNAGDLAGMLADGDVTVEGQGPRPNIVLDAPLSWTSASALTLNSQNHIVFNSPLVVAGPGGLNLIGVLEYSAKGHVELWDKTSALTIDQEPYVLAFSFGDLVHLAKTAQYIALAKSVRAPKKTFPSSPIPSFGSDFGWFGMIDGLGNAISHLTIDDETTSDPVGLVGTLHSGSFVSHIVLSDVSVRGSGVEKITGSLIGENMGGVYGASATGTVTASGSASYAGGLVGRNETGTVIRSHAGVDVSVDGTAFVEGGLVGFSASDIEFSYATGAVHGADDTTMGGLVGINDEFVRYCYATGAVSGGDAAIAGGLVGGNGTDDPTFAFISDSYATGAASGGPHAFIGGVIGSDAAETPNDHDYWDLDLSGVNAGAGNRAHDPGLKGLTTAEFQSGLPRGLSKSIWAEAPDVNGGFPYLRDQPPF